LLVQYVLIPITTKQP